MDIEMDKKLPLFNNLEDFKLFLYVHIAYADGIIDPRETSLIIEKMDFLFPQQYNHEDRYEEEKKRYMSLDANDVKATIETNFMAFNNIDQTTKTKIFRDLFEIINADSIVLDTETDALDELKKIMQYSNSN